VLGTAVLHTSSLISTASRLPWARPTTRMADNTKSAAPLLGQMMRKLSYAHMCPYAMDQCGNRAWCPSRLVACTRTRFVGEEEKH
jgi:hypothetical protein